MDILTPSIHRKPTRGSLLDITPKKYKSWLILQCRGRIVLRTINTLNKTLIDVLEQTPKCAFDISHTDLIDSSGIRFFHQLHFKKQLRGTIFAIYGANISISEVFSITNLPKVIPVFDDKYSFYQFAAKN